MHVRRWSGARRLPEAAGQDSGQEQQESKNHGGNATDGHRKRPGWTIGTHGIRGNESSGVSGCTHHGSARPVHAGGVRRRAVKRCGVKRCGLKCGGGAPVDAVHGQQPEDQHQGNEAATQKRGTGH